MFNNLRKVKAVRMNSCNCWFNSDNHLINDVEHCTRKRKNSLRSEFICLDLVYIQETSGEWKPYEYIEN